jgi:hypothetical protein
MNQDSISQCFQFLLGMSLDGALGCLNHRGDELFVISQVLKPKAIYSVLKFPQPPRDVLKPRVAATRQRSHKNKAQFFSKNASENRY